MVDDIIWTVRKRNRRLETSVAGFLKLWTPATLVKDMEILFRPGSRLLV